MQRSFGLPSSLLVVLLFAIPGVSASGEPEPVGCAAGTHELTFLNSCSYTVWLAELGNTSSGSCTESSECIAGLQTCNVPVCSGATDCPAIECTADADCPAPGQTCPAATEGGATRFCTPACQAGGNCACTTATGCPGGGVCTGGVCGGGVCQFDTIAPTSWELQRGVPTTICVPKGWQGRFWGRTGCTEQDGGLQCRTGQCGPPYPATGELACTKSGNSPATLFEPTFDAGDPAVDFYDVSLVGGYNVPIEVKPGLATCIASGSCTQDLNATCPAALRVLGPACTAGKCPAGGACVGDTCVIGCLDPCDACGMANPSPELDCATNKDFYCCEGSQTSNSCNSASATCFDDGDCRNLANGILQASCDTTTNLCMKSCTGNADCPGGTCDTAAGKCAPPLVSCATESCAAAVPPQPNPICDSGILGGVCVPTADCCGPYNTGWTAAAKVAGGGSATWTSIFKAACPTAYSYQFDDPSSTFTCADPAGGEVDYEITFCPVPEPSAWLQAAVAFGALRLLQTRRRIGAKRPPVELSRTSRN